MNDVSIDLYGRQIDLSKQKVTLDQIQNYTHQKENEQLAEQGKFPDEGTIFSIENKLFKIIYINKGKKRLSAIWYDDKTQPFDKLPELGSSCSIYGKIYKVTFHNKTVRRITIEPVEI